MFVLGVIPARGGSKGIPRKNVLLLAGKPLITWSIEAALESQALDAVLVSTDDEEIGQVSHAAGASVPFYRPHSLAEDDTSIYPVLRHAVNEFERKNSMVDVVVALQPTSPLRTAADIDRAISKIVESDSEITLSVAEVDHSPFWSVALDSGGPRPLFLDHHPRFRRQDEKKAYRVNGAVFAIKRDTLFKTQCLSFVEAVYSSHNVTAIEMDRKSSVDIDDMMDFTIAESIIATRKKEAGDADRSS